MNAGTNEERKAKIAADIHELDTTGLVLTEIAINAIQIPVIGKPIVRGMTAVIKLCGAVMDLFSKPEGAHE